MPRTPVIGVLTPFTGGFYYGAAMAGIQRVAAARGASVVAIHTTGLELGWSDAPDEQYLGLDSVDGWLAVNQFQAPAFTARIRARGVPLVHVNSRDEWADGCSVLPDNRTSIRAAVRHLIEHGHRRIAFAGFLGQIDLRERHEGYVAALREAELEVDPRLLFESQANFESDGEALGQRIIAAGRPCTALVAGTDRLALGLLTALRNAGVLVPRDLALIGFDDIEKAQLVDPPLTTVRQNFGLVAATATRTLLGHLLDGAPLPSLVRVPTVFVARQSCGCKASYSLPPPPRSATLEPTTELTRALLEVAAHGLGEAAATWPDARTIAELLVGISRGQGQLDGHDSNELWGGFLEGQRDAASVDQVLTVLESAVHGWSVDDVAAQALGSALRQLRVALIRNWRRLEIERNRYYESVAESNAKVNHALALWRPTDGMDLSWLGWTRAAYACLGLWSAASGEQPRTLRIVGEYGAGAASERIRGTSHVPAHFPPPQLSTMIRTLGVRNVLIVVPLVSGGKNRGLLAIAAPIEVELLEHVGNAGDWAAQLAAAFERAEVDLQLRRNAFHDSLTGLPNRAFLLERLAEFARERSNSRTAVLLLDLDDFKRINDSKGHQAGDQLLLEIAVRLERTIAGSGVVARLGGDEFAIALPNAASERDALQTIVALQASLSEPFSIDGDVVFTSCSIGVAFSGEEGAPASPAALLRDADTAMYRAKLQGRGGHEVFDHGMHMQAVERLRLDSRLRQALEREEFTLVYQPIVSLVSGRPIGAEALIRWAHPEQGSLSPARFLSVAEDMGLGIPIGKWVLETACRHAKSWQRDDGSLAYVSVNVSAEHVQSPGFIDFIERVLLKTELPPHALSLELVESSLANERDLTRRVLGRLLDMGVRVAIDDFGTGYSSLSYLKDFPVSVLKIDRSFVQGLPADTRDVAIATAIISMSHGLGLSVIAEGVETEGQLQALRAQGCDAVQGYFLSRPLELDAYRRFLSGDNPAPARKPSNSGLLQVV